MCPPLFSEETTFDSILVNDLLRKRTLQLGFLGGCLREVRLVLQFSFNVKTGENNKYMKMTEAEKGQKYRFTYTSQWELRNLFSVVYIEVTHEAIVTQ